MQIIVLQLARFGDIYQTWPTLKALVRSNPEADIHLVVRERFQAATIGLSGVTVHAMPTRAILEPIVNDQPESNAVAVLDSFLAPLKALKADRVINLSFSPLSSYLTDILSESGAQVSGYTRFSDGPLAIPDDMSAYFYAQVGIGRPNRYHITDIFASVAGVELNDADFAAPSSLERKGVVVHMGASTNDKTYAPELWIAALQRLQVQKLTLIGSQNERGLSEAVQKNLNFEVANLVGQTELPELFTLLAQSELLIGADSAPVHIGALTATPTLNLSSKTVNCFETGPRAAGSRILYSDNINELSPALVAEEALAMLKGEGPTGPCLTRAQVLGDFELHGMEADEFEWKLIQALYTATDYPPAETATQLLAMQRIQELADLARLQLSRWSQPDKKIEAAQVLAQVDELLPQVSELEPSVAPLVNWFQTERLRIPPGTETDTLNRTTDLFAQLELIASVYVIPTGETELLTEAQKHARKLLPELRECDLGSVNYEFQNLITALEGLARLSTKVGNGFWKGLLAEFTGALEAKNFLHLADLTECELLPEISRRLNGDVSASNMIS